MENWREEIAEANTMRVEVAGEVTIAGMTTAVTTAEMIGDERAHAIPCICFRRLGICSLNAPPPPPALPSKY